MSKTMAEVIHAHHCLERIHNEGCMFWQEDHESAAALSAAGFGLVADAKAEAWAEGWAARAWRDPVYRVPDTNPYRATP